LIAGIEERTLRVGQFGTSRESGNR
jgi:hypothetical protein